MLHKLLRARFHCICENVEQMRRLMFTYFRYNCLTLYCVIYPESSGSGGINTLVLVDPSAVCLWANKHRPSLMWPCAYNKLNLGLLGL